MRQRRQRQRSVRVVWLRWLLCVGLSWFSVCGVVQPARAWVQMKVKSTGQPMHWTKTTIPYAIDSAGLGDYFTKNPQYGSVGSEFAAVELAFQTWSSVFCPQGGALGITLQSQGRAVGKQPGVDVNCDNCNTNLVVFITDKAKWTRSSTELAVTIPTAREKTGQIFDADLLINAAHFTLTTQTTNTENIKWDIQNMVTHEVGHFLGLGHSLEPKATMYAQSREKNLEMRSLHEDDVTGICTIYPPKQLTGKIPIYTEKQKDRGLGCDASENGAGLVPLWVLVFGLGLLGMRRRREVAE